MNRSSSLTSSPQVNESPRKSTRSLLAVLRRRLAPGLGTRVSWSECESRRSSRRSWGSPTTRVSDGTGPSAKYQGRSSMVDSGGRSIRMV